MRDLGKIVTHIPARGGSKRVPSKNLRYIAGQPLLAYTVRAALACKSLQAIYVNTDSDLIAALAEELGALVYRRCGELASDTATSDQFNLDIIQGLNPDTLVMINPVCPLIETSDIEAALEAYRRDTADTLITSTATQMQCFYQGQPVNIDLNAQLAPSQHNDPIHICNWAITIWDAHKYQERYERQGFAVFGDQLKLLAIDLFKATKISTEEDFKLAEAFIQAKKQLALGAEAMYWSR